jgi:hypothetical protein
MWSMGYFANKIFSKLYKLEKKIDILKEIKDLDHHVIVTSLGIYNKHMEEMHNQFCNSLINALTVTIPELKLKREPIPFKDVNEDIKNALQNNQNIQRENLEKKYNDNKL